MAKYRISDIFTLSDVSGDLNRNFNGQVLAIETSYLRLVQRRWSSMKWKLFNVRLFNRGELRVLELLREVDKCQQVIVTKLVDDNIVLRAWEETYRNI